MKKINQPKYINFKTFVERNGTLVPFYTKKTFPKNFKLKRFFTLYGKKKYFRADHAHKKCSQIIIPLRGEVTLEIKSKSFTQTYKLSVRRKKALLIPPFNWVKIYFSNNNNSILTLCNYKYDKKEYISDIDEFKRIINK